MSRTLKYIRWAAAAIIGAAILLFFLDFAELLPVRLKALLQIQFVPALISGSVVVVLSILLFTLIFGRLYCSILCPLGILQDFILRIKKWIFGKRKNGKKRLRTRYEKPYNYIRYGFLGITVVTFVAGSAFFLLLLDPYSNFGRITIAFFKPAVLYVNNLIAGIANRAGNYTFYNVSIEYQPWLLLLFAGIILIVLVVLVWRKERIWCNTVCPVGTLLGLFSRYSLFRIQIDGSKCTHCKKCTFNCKSRCIDDVSAQVDTSRCVTCFDCLGSCKGGGISYVPTGWKRNTQSTQEMPVGGVTTDEFGESRRRFIAGGIVALAAVPLNGRAAQAAGLSGRRYPLPPGAGSLKRFRRKCTACQLCIGKCPAHVLKPAFFENGIDGMMQPYMHFSVHKFCQFECNLCTEICPNGALQKMTLEEKKRIQVGVVHFIKEKCVVYAKEEYCGACAEHCPTQAVHMNEYKNGLTIPTINPEICIGCGACESICPVRPDAIFIVGNEEQVQAKTPEIQESETVEVDDFGF